MSVATRGWRRLPWRTLLALALLVTAARVFLCTTLKIPTGSMEPTLHGDPLTGDEILVFKPWYRLFAPQRFDLVVFERTSADARADERVAVKRVAALGGESVRIEEGDLFVTPAGAASEARVVKSYAEFRPLLIPLWRERCEPGGRELGTFEPDGARFDDGYLDEQGVVHEGEHAVRDLLFEIELETLAADAVLEFSFQLGAGDELKFLLAPSAGAHAVRFAHSSDGVVHDDASSTIRFVTPNEKHRLEFWHVDGHAGCAIDGRANLDQPLHASTGSLAVGAQVRDVALHVLNGGARLARFDVWRDLHYTEPSDARFARHGDAFTVPDGELFVLGDASGASIDGRHFGSIPERDLLGRPLFVVGPSGRRRALR